MQNNCMILMANVSFAEDWKTERSGQSACAINDDRFAELPLVLCMTYLGGVGTYEGTKSPSFRVHHCQKDPPLSSLPLSDVCFTNASRLVCQNISSLSWLNVSTPLELEWELIPP